MNRKFIEQGFTQISNFMPKESLEEIDNDIIISSLDLATSGIRHIDKKLKSISTYLASGDFFNSANPYLSPQHKLVRAILFNKTPDTNWYVTWHQDRTVAVSEKFDDPEWKSWSLKEGVLHVQPPLTVLENMVTIRIHLDHTTKENGCLKVIPGSHQMGLLTQNEIQQLVEKNRYVHCEADTGDALIIRPHLLHASNKANIPSQRRVLHFEFSDWTLPEGISWA